MASKIHVELADDLDGGPADETVRFSLDGKHYEIDLSEKNAGVLREMFGEYISAARKAGKNTVSKQSNIKSATPASKIREWASDNGYETKDRGRIPAEIQKAYQDAQLAA